jgi:NitT/TauT family transport system ATP-binding protein
MCLAGLYRPSAGAILKDGLPIEGPGPDRAMVFQDYALFPWRSVADNIGFGLSVRRNRIARGERDGRVDALIRLVGLQGFAGYYPHQLSGGMRQRVGIARALAVNPDVLLMDEPFGSLDALTRENMQSEMVRIWQEARRTIIFVTHSIEEALILGDRVLVLTARPARIQEVVPVPLDRPRSREDPRLVELRAHVRRLISTDSTRGA